MTGVEEQTEQEWRLARVESLRVRNEGLAALCALAPADVTELEEAIEAAKS